ncbi:hybrid sensor histidine kinase/response regulator [Leptospira ilyithenensis]|uniref:histidine kinase n=1 Tax=Leptospira ilyithenensis TaxID=2484901 RepID=A0A4R9LR70_9LEPT|nr:ATP-binding protein [Leptospira ilyithenensis]TGN10372.1 response regulator [Leptospira ilyithenensis]
MIPHILIFDPSRSSAEVILKYIEELNYTAEHVVDENSFRASLREGRFSISIIEATSIPSDGDTFFEKLKQNYPDLLILLTANESMWNHVSQYLNQHRAYDFIPKPVEKGKFKIAAERAVDFFILKQKAETVKEGENVLFRKMIEIFDWKKSLTGKESDNIAGHLIHQMNISLFQGSGIGTLMSIVSVLLSRSKFDESTSTYNFNKNLFDLIQENYEAARGMIDSMTISQTIIDDSEDVEDFLPSQILFEITNGEVSDLNEALNLKNQKISVSGLPSGLSNSTLRCNTEKMKNVIRELLINAMKYSKENDTIYIIFFLKENFLELKILNPAYENPDHSVGVTGKHEQLVFEPFYRISSVVDDNYAKYEQFRFGLGLSLIRKIMEQHNANIEIYTIENNIRENKASEVCLTLRFPLKR